MVVFLSSPPEIRDSKHCFVIVNNIFAYFTLSLSAAQVYMIQERCWFSKIDFFVEKFPHRINVLFLSSQFLSHPHTQIRVTLFDGVRIGIPNKGLSPNHVSIGCSQIA